MRRGDGVVVSSSYPFEISLEISVTFPLDIELGVEDIFIDTSSFWGDDE